MTVTPLQRSPVLPHLFGTICLVATLCAATVQAQTSFLWTNAVSGNWSAAANWSNNISPPVGGRTNLALTFLGSGGYSATNDLAGGFTNNQLTLNCPAAAGTLQGNPLRFVSNGATAPALVQQGAADFAIANAVTLTGTLGVSLNGAGAVALTGPVDGAGGITVQGGGSGALTLTRSNSFGGVITLNAGTLIAAHSFALGTTASLTVVANGTATSRLGLEGGIALVEPVRLGGRQPLPNASGLAAHVINLAGTNSLTGNLTGDAGGNQYNVESAAGLLIVAGNYSQFSGTGGRYLNLQGAGEARWTGAINDGTASVYLTKRGSGRWTLAGTNTYTGPTLVTEGTLLVNGISGTNTVTVTNATLGGAGVVGGATTLQDGGVLAPGNGLGTLTISNNLTLGTGSTTVLEVSRSPLTNDVVRVTGVLTFGGTLAVTNVGAAPLANGDDFQLFTFGGSGGAFATMSLPALTNGLFWDTSLLATAGRVRVVSDSDGDGLPDGWEIQYFTNLLQTATGDPDADSFNNLAEYLAGSNPTNILSTPNDLDADGLPDAWEAQYFGNLAQTGSGDPDGDGYSNAAELAVGSNPANALSSPADSDGDGLPDAWELARFGNLSQTANGDPDDDWMTNLQEYQMGTDPVDPESKVPGPRVRLQWVDDGNPATSEYAYPGGINTAAFIRAGIQTVGNQQFMTYYGRHQSDATYSFNNTLWVARRTVDADLWQVFRTGFTANNVTDGHDSISFGIDGSGFMHLSWGMHADAFHYARSLTPVTGTNVIAFGPDGTMTGKENTVTYPQFLNLPNGDLLYLFREVGSGNGDLFLNRYRIASQTWTNVHLNGTSQLSFIKGTGWTPNYNAYWQQPCVTASGQIFLVWTWRYNSDSPAGEVGYQTNHDYDYAWSPDEGVTWKRSSGTNYVLPINERGENGNTNSKAEKVLSIPEGSSLMNQSGMCLDRSGQPVLANWWAPGAITNNHRRQYMVAFPGTNTSWEVRQISFRTIDSPTNKVPEAALGSSKMGRPTIVCDKDDRLIVIYSDNEGSAGLTVAHTLPKALDPQRLVWTQFDLTTNSLTGFDAPNMDLVRWDQDNVLHVFYKLTGGQGYTSTNSADSIGVLEWDAATYFNPRPDLRVALTNGAVRITWPAQPGWGYQVQSSTNLLDWTPVTTLAGTPWNLEAVIPMPSVTSVFWRVALREGGF